MTYQQPTPKHDDDNADEASSLLLTVAGGGGVPATRKTHRVPMRAMIATTCVLLGTLAVLYSGGRGSNRHNNTHLTEGISTALLHDQNQAARVFDPNHSYCYKDNDHADTYCWTPLDRLPRGNWKYDGGRGYNDCGPQCTPTLYNPSLDYCFKDNDNAGKYCWYPNDATLPYGNWYVVTDHGYNDCGPKCWDVAPPKECAPATGPFHGLSCKSSAGNCYPNQHLFETCYVSNNPPPNDKCWSRSHTVRDCGWTGGICITSYHRCDPVGYNDGDTGYDKDGIWHVAGDGDPVTCGNPCQDFK